MVTWSNDNKPPRCYPKVINLGDFMKKVLLGICVLLITQTSFAGHHEKSGKATKTIIGYEILDGERLEIVAGKSSNVDIWVEYVEAHNKRELETIDSMNADDFEGRAANGIIVKGPEAHAAFLKEWFATSNPSWKFNYAFFNNILINVFFN